MKSLVWKCILHATFTFSRAHVSELGEGEEEEAGRQRDAVAGERFPMQIP